jgi:YfiH family protein
MTLPPVADPFYWTAEAWGAALRCRALDGVARHLFSTRLPRVSPGIYQTLGQTLGAPRLVTAAQVHGAAVLIIRPRDRLPEPAREADVIVTGDPDVAVAVRSADCVGLLIGDRRTGAAAAVHAGWRGTASGGASAAVAALTREFGSRPDDLVAALGPHIGVCCYAVGSELVDAFAAAGYERYLIDRWFPARPPARGSRDRPALSLDLGLANHDQLVLAGLSPGHIHRSNLCTAEHLDALTSYRAEGAAAGRMVAVIRGANG